MGLTRLRDEALRFLGAAVGLEPGSTPEFLEDSSVQGTLPLTGLMRRGLVQTRVFRIRHLHNAATTISTNDVDFLTAGDWDTIVGIEGVNLSAVPRSHDVMISRIGVSVHDSAITELDLAQVITYPGGSGFSGPGLEDVIYDTAQALQMGGGTNEGTGAPSAFAPRQQVFPMVVDPRLWEYNFYSEVSAANGLTVDFRLVTHAIPRGLVSLR